MPKSNTVIVRLRPVALQGDNLIRVARVLARCAIEVPTAALVNLAAYVEVDDGPVRVLPAAAPPQPPRSEADDGAPVELRGRAAELAELGLTVRADGVIVDGEGTVTTPIVTDTEGSAVTKHRGRVATTEGV